MGVTASGEQAQYCRNSQCREEGHSFIYQLLSPSPCSLLSSRNYNLKICTKPPRIVSLWSRMGLASCPFDWGLTMSPPLEPQWAPRQQIQSGSSRSKVEGSVRRLSCAPGSKLQGAIEMVLNTGQRCPSSINTNTEKKTKQQQQNNHRANATRAAVWTHCSRVTRVNQPRRHREIVKPHRETACTALAPGPAEG